MGTVKKSAPGTPAPAFPLKPFEDTASGLRANLLAVLTALVIKPTQAFPQAGLRFLFLLRVLIKDLEAMVKAVEAAVVAHHGANGTFAPGKYALTFPSTSRRSVKWKEEALTLAETLAKLRGETFDAEAYVTRITESYTPTVSTGIAITESV